MMATALRHFQHSSIRNILCETEVFPPLDWRPLCTGVSYRSSALETCCVCSSVEFFAHERQSIHGSVLLDAGCLDVPPRGVCWEHEYEGDSHDFIGQPLSHDTETVQCGYRENCTVRPECRIDDSFFVAPRGV